ncbi:hypothetical protein LXL04_008170 [Taraxacum kok-saghyz]
MNLQIMWPTNTSFVDLLNTYEVSEPVQSIHFVTSPSEVQFPLPNDDRCETGNEFGLDEPNPQFNEDNVSESLRDVGDDYDDNVNETSIVSKSPIMNFMNDIGDVGYDDVVDIQDNIHLDFWN